MKTFSVSILILILILILNCSPAKNVSQNSDYYKPLGSERTIFLIDQKEYSMQEFNKIYNDGKIKSLKVITDSTEIEKMGYPLKVKRIILGEN